MSKGTATEIEICGEVVNLGDYVKVRYTTGKRFKGGIIAGKITELWSLEKDNHLQGRVENGWCFHDHDKILSHNEVEWVKNPTSGKGGLL